MDIVCVDTQILFWSLGGKVAKGAETIAPRAIAFMKWLDKQDVRIVIPTIVIGEMLIPVDEQDHPAVLSKLKQDWIIAEFDLRAAVIFARIRREHIQNRRYEDMRNLLPDVTKKELDADTMIIAIAIAQSATKIYSHNKNLRTLAEGHIVALSFEDENYQLSLDMPDKDS
jgi:hypothetical protein